MRGRVAANTMTGIGGCLRAVLPAYTLRAYPLHAVYAPTSYVPAKIRAFIDLMARHVRSGPALAAGG